MSHSPPNHAAIPDLSIYDDAPADTVPMMKPKTILLLVQQPDNPPMRFCKCKTIASLANSTFICIFFKIFLPALSIQHDVLLFFIVCKVGSNTPGVPIQ